MALTVKLLIAGCIVMQLQVDLQQKFKSQLELLSVHVCIYGIFQGTVSFIFNVH